MAAAAHHFSGIRELDLTACQPNSLVDKISAVPGLKTSAAFFVFLRANLALNQAALSACNTPKIQPYLDDRHSPSQPPSPSLTATSYSTASSARSLPPLGDIPPLSLEPLRSDDDKEDAIRLISASVSQQQAKACTAVRWHPITLACTTTSLATIHRLAPTTRASLTWSFTLVTASLLALWYITRRYRELAGSLSRSWLRDDDLNREDIILGAKVNNTLVAVLSLRIEPLASINSAKAPKLGRKRHSRATSSLKGGKGIIRAWTTRTSHRGKGIGRELLCEAVRVTRERCGKDAKIGFAREHVNSTKVLPEVFCGGMRKEEVRAGRTLESVVTGWDGMKRRR